MNGHRQSLALAALCLFVIPAIAGEPQPHHLVDLNTIRPPILPEVRYATRANFTREVLYPAPVLFIHKDAAAALAKVQQALAVDGLTLKVYDAYRPLSVQQKMWDIIRDERYVSNPAVNRGRHTRGTAVDVTLVDRNGNELEMPSPFDDFTDAAHRTSPTMTDTQRTHMLKLQSVMKAHGFVPYPYEWWHYDFRDWKSYPVLDIPYEALIAGEKTTVPVE